MNEPLPHELPPEIRRQQVIIMAKEQLARSANVTGNNSIALALQGILSVMIEQLEGQGDSYESPDPIAIANGPGGLPLPTWGVQP